MPIFGRKGPIVYESTKREIRRNHDKPNLETESRCVIRLPVTLFVLLLVCIVFLPEESRAVAAGALDFLIETAKAWILRPNLN